MYCTHKTSPICNSIIYHPSLSPSATAGTLVGEEENIGSLQRCPPAKFYLLPHPDSFPRHGPLGMLVVEWVDPRHDGGDGMDKVLRKVGAEMVPAVIMMAGVAERRTPTPLLRPNAVQFYITANIRLAFKFL